MPGGVHLLRREFHVREDRSVVLARPRPRGCHARIRALTRTLNGFFSILLVCHTVLAAVDPNTGAIEYRAQSPEEEALVQATADAGFVFRDREKEIMRLQTPFSDEVEEYELLNVLDFTSARKRMSVIMKNLYD